MSFKEKHDRLKKQLAGLSGDLLVEVEQKIKDLSELLDDLPDEVSLKFTGDKKSPEADKHKEKIKEVKKNWNTAKKTVDGLFSSTTKKKKSGGSSESRKNITKEEKQKSIKTFIETASGSFTRADLEKHLGDDFGRVIALQFYKPMLDHLVDNGVVTKKQTDKDNPKSAITYGLKQNKQVDFSGMK